MADTKKTTTAEKEKDKTARSGKAVAAPPRAKSGGMFAFIGEVRREMSKVTWPTWKETWLTTVVVLIMVGLTMVFFLVVDWALGAGVRWLIGA